jgi:hypothetical protein
MGWTKLTITAGASRVVPALATVLALLTTACSSSSSSGNAPGSTDAGNPDASSSDLDTDAAMVGINATCGNLSILSGGSASICGQGQTCCTTISLGASITSLGATSACVATGQCSGGVSNECNTASDCSGGQVCCSGAPSTDAAAPSGGGLLGGISLAILDTTCQTSCTSTQRQQCASDAECPSGMTCQSAAAAGGFGGLGGGAGLPDGGADGGAFMLAMVCAVPVSDAGSGAPDSGTTPDAGASVDAGATPDGAAAVDGGDAAAPP